MQCLLTNGMFIDLLARSSIRIDIFRELLSIVTADVKGLTRAIRGRESGRVIVFVCLSSAYCFHSIHTIQSFKLEIDKKNDPVFYSFFIYLFFVFLNA